MRVSLDFARERDDLLSLLLSAALVPLTWLLLGWRWPLCVSGYDAWATALPLLNALAEAGGDWAALAYRPDLLGGVRLRDSVGPNPLAALLARAGLPATAVYNLCAFALQAAIGFLGARTAEDLARAWSAPEARRLDWPLRAAACVLCAFTPALGWRLGYGHLALTTGLLVFAAALALVAAAAAGRLGVTLVAVAVLAAANGLLFTGHQLVLYGVVFGTPLLAGIALGARRPLRVLALAAAALLAALALALPALLPVLGQGFSGDAPRPPTGLRITYSYLTAGPADWLSSLPWTRAAIPGQRPPLHHHESNVPLGPLLALLALVPWRRLRPLACALIVVTALMLAFSMDVRPVSTLLLALVPPLGSFRVPTRAALPLLLALAPLAVAAVARVAVGAARAPGWAAGTGAFALLALAPPAPREILGWAAALAAVTYGWRRAIPANAAAVLLLALAGGATGAFGQRLLRPFRDTGAVLAEARDLGRQARVLAPEMASPLVRVAVAGGIPELGANTAFAAGLSSLDGYFFPSRRLIALVGALRRQPYDASAFVVRVAADEPAARVLFPLYNVRYALRNAGAPAVLPSVPSAVPPPRPPASWRVAMEPLAPTAGPAWFSERTQAAGSVQDLAERLRGLETDVVGRLRSVAWVVDTDPAARALPPAGECGAAAVTAVQATAAGTITVSVDGARDCPLTIATTFAESLRGRARVAGAWRDARLFPVYGALLGAWVPEGATEVVIAPR